MRAVIFAAGLGTRLRPLTDMLPKPLIEVGGLSILERTLAALPAAVTEAIVVVGYKGEMIRERLAGSARTVRFVDQPELHGTYDALIRAKDLIGPGSFLALNGDDLYAKADLERLAAAEPFAMLAHKVPTPNPYSHLENEGGFLTRIALNKDSEALAEREVYVGACLLDGDFFGLAPAILPNGERGLPQTLALHLNKRPVRVLESTFWMPVGTPEELEAARAAFAR